MEKKEILLEIGLILAIVFVDNWYAYVIWIFKSHNNYVIFLSFIAFFVLKH